MTRTRNRLGWIVATVSQLSIVALLTACDRNPLEPKREREFPKNPRIAFIGTFDGDPAWPAIVGGARRFANKIDGVILDVLVPADASGSSLERSALEALERKPHCICLSTPNRPETSTLIRRLVGEGVFVVSIGDSLDAQDAHAHVLVDWPKAGELLGTELARVAGGKKSYVLIHDDGASETGTRIYNRFRAEAVEQSGMKLLMQSGPASNHGSAADQVRAALQTFPNAGLVITLSPRAWRESKPEALLGASNLMATIGATPELWDSVRDGRATAIVGCIEGDVGYAAVDLAMRALIEGKRLGIVREIEMELVTRDSIEEFVTRYRRAARY